MEAASNLLASIMLDSLCKPFAKVTTLPHDSTIQEAMDAMKEANILSAPVVVSADVEDLGSGTAEMSPQLLGWLSVSDLLKVFLDEVRQKRCGALPTSMLALMALLEAEGPAFRAKSLVTIRGVEDRGLVFAGDAPTTSLLDAIRDYFLKPGPYGESRVVHRLAVFDAHGEVKHILSQTDIIRTLNSHVGALGPAADSTLETLGLVKLAHPALTVDPHEPALIAMDKLLQQQMGGAPVVNSNGELVANLSISDLRGLGSQHWGALALPVAEFLALEHKTTYLGFSASPQPAGSPKFASQNRKTGPQKGDIQLFTCTKETTLRHLLAQIVDNHIHRVFVMNGGKVQGVLTLTDLLRWCSGVC